MSPTLNNDILLCIVEIVAEDYCQPEVPNPYEDPMGAWKAHYINQSYGRDLTAKGLLLALRRTCRFLATITMPFLFSHVTIDRIDKKNARRLNAICKSDLHCSAVKKYILKPEIVHTAPVVKSNPWKYYGELCHDSCGPEPRYSTLVAEHEMRQRVKAHFDEQYAFLVPDYGSLSHITRICVQWLSRDEPVGSAFHTSIFLIAMDKFERLLELEICYPSPRSWRLLSTVAEDLSIGLGKYLTKRSGERLQTLRLEQVYSSDLEVLVLALRNSSQSSHSFPTALPSPDLPMPGSWPLVSQPTSPPPAAMVMLHMTTLDILFAQEDYDGLGECLRDLLLHTVNLRSLKLRSLFTYGDFNLYPSLAGLLAPPLPCLQHLTVENMIIDAQGVLSLTRPNKESLRKISLRRVALSGGTWAEIGSEFIKEMKGVEGVDGLRMGRVGYLPADGGLTPTAFDPEDRSVWQEWMC